MGPGFFYARRKGDGALGKEAIIRSNLFADGFPLRRMLAASVAATMLALATVVPARAETVSLQWDPNSDADLAGYKLYYTPTTSPLTSATPLDVGLQTTTAVTGLDPGQSYNFAVTAYNWSGTESSFSNIVTLAEQVAPLAPPTLEDVLKAFQYANGQTTLTPGEVTGLDCAPLGTNGTPNPNGIVDMADVTLLLRRLVGLVTW